MLYKRMWHCGSHLIYLRSIASRLRGTVISSMKVSSMVGWLVVMTARFSDRLTSLRGSTTCAGGDKKEVTVGENNSTQPRPFQTATSSKALYLCPTLTLLYTGCVCIFPSVQPQEDSVRQSSTMNAATYGCNTRRLCVVIFVVVIVG